MRKITTGFIFLTFLSSHSFAEDIRDITPPVDPPVDYFWLILLLIALCLMGAIFLIKFLSKKAKRRKQEKTIRKHPWEMAIEQLEMLKEEHLPAAGKIKEHYIKLSDIVRHYIENRFDIRAPEMTTEEFLLTVKNSHGLRNHHKELLKDFLNSCDMVKFAKYGPTMDEIEDSDNLARKFIEETKETPPVYQNNKQ